MVSAPIIPFRVHSKSREKWSFFLSISTKLSGIPSYGRLWASQI